MGIVGRYLYATAIAEVRSFTRAWHNICVFVGHVVTTLRIILLNDLEASGAALRAVRLPPLLDLDVGPLGTLNVGMPGTFTPHAPPIRAVGTLDLCRNQTSRPRVIAVDYHTALHHGVAVSRQINEGPTFQAVDALPEHGSIIKVDEFAVLRAA